MLPYDYSVSRRTLVLTVPSDLRSTNVEPITKDIHAVLEGCKSRNEVWTLLHLNLTAANMIDSAGLNMIVSLIRLATVAGARVRVSVSNPHVHRTFTFTRLDRQIDLELVGGSSA